MADGILIENLVKTYGEGDTAVHALRGVDMHVAPGEVVGLIGPSGSGKSTLLKCLGAVIEPTSGRMTIGEEIIYDNEWKIPDLRALRRDRIGFIFQSPYLIPFLDVTDNVALLPMLAGETNAKARARAVELLTALDVAHRARAMPSQLSGGEQQRDRAARWGTGAGRGPDSERHGGPLPDRDNHRHPRREDHPHVQTSLQYPGRADARGNRPRGVCNLKAAGRGLRHSLSS